MTLRCERCGGPVEVGIVPAVVTPRGHSAVALGLREFVVVIRIFGRLCFAVTRSCFVRCHGLRRGGGPSHFVIVGIFT